MSSQLSFTLHETDAEQLIAGVDEVGRGPLAGDVVAAAVILPQDHALQGLNDSKKLSDKRRNALFLQIQEVALAWAVGRASVAEIDRLNILHASLLAMHRAVESLSRQPEFIYVDGNRCPDWQYPSQAVVKGDSRVEAIAAASIIAKVTRDRELQVLDKRYPQYGLAGHKGYPTKKHIEALRQFGPSPIHRRSFGPVAACLEKTES